jgi:hypothetical protein
MLTHPQNMAQLCSISTSTHWLGLSFCILLPIEEASSREDLGIIGQAASSRQLHDVTSITMSIQKGRQVSSWQSAQAEQRLGKRKTICRMVAKLEEQMIIYILRTSSTLSCARALVTMCTPHHHTVPARNALELRIALKSMIYRSKDEGFAIHEM